MRKLIDADVLLENAIKYNIGRKSFEEMIKCVKEQPTAYDLEKVVEQLEELKNKRFVSGITNNAYEFGACHAIDMAIEIVRRGGVK